MSWNLFSQKWKWKYFYSVDLIWITADFGSDVAIEIGVRFNLAEVVLQKRDNNKTKFEH